MSSTHRLSRASLAAVPLLCTALLAVSAPLQAESAATEPNAPQTLEEAAELRDQGSRLRDAAEETHKTESAACYKKILVNDCLVDAKQRYTQSMIEARNLDTPGRDFQREAHRAEVEAKAAQRAADQAKRMSEQRAKADAYRAEQAAKTAKREKKLAEREARQRRQTPGENAD